MWVFFFFKQCNILVESQCHKCGYSTCEDPVLHLIGIYVNILLVKGTSFDHWLLDLDCMWCGTLSRGAGLFISCQPFPSALVSLYQLFNIITLPLKHRLLCILLRHLKTVIRTQCRALMLTGLAYCTVIVANTHTQIGSACLFFRCSGIYLIFFLNVFAIKYSEAYNYFFLKDI